MHAFCNIPSFRHGLGLLLLLTGFTSQALRSQPTLPAGRAPVSNVYSLDGKTTLRLLLTPVQTATKVQLNGYGMLTGRSSADSARVRSPEAVFLTIPLEKPSMQQLRIGKSSLEVFLLPDDTTTVTARIDQKSGQVSHWEVKGSTQPVNEYYKAKVKQLGYWETRQVSTGLATSKSTYTGLARAADSLAAVEQRFLDTYPDSLPDWFRQTEQEHIRYFAPAYKTFLPFLNQTYMIFKDQLPADYYAFLKDLPVSNPKALLSDWYILFLDEYLLVYNNPAFEQFNKLSGETRVKAVLAVHLPKIKAELTGEVKDAYLTRDFYRLLDVKTNTARQAADSALTALTSEFSNPEYVEHLRRTITAHRQQALLKPVEKAPDFTLADPKGQPVSLSQLQGKVVFINFWGSWCKPCIAALPEKKKLAGQFAGQEVVFVNVCIGDTKEKWLAALDKYGISGVNLFADPKNGARLRKEYAIQRWPRYVLIDKQGKLAESYTDPQTAAAQIKTLLK